MQTRRDQLQAYRFQNRRALAALVAGQPNAVEPPLRRMTITTVSGIMIAVLVAVGFGIFGLIRPTAGDAWKDPGVIVVEAGTGATFVYLDGKLHTVANYASAVLAVSGGRQAKTVTVEHSDLASTPRGAPVGIAGLPDSLPGRSGLVSSPVTVCSRQQTQARDRLTARVTVTVGGDLGSRSLSGDTGLVVVAGPGSTPYLLFDGRRLAIPRPQIARALQLDGTAALRVGTAFLDGVPLGPELAPPRLPGQSTLVPDLRINGVVPKVGQLIRQSASDYSVVLRDGIGGLDTVQTALLQTLTIGDGASPLAPIDVTPTQAAALPVSRTWEAIRARGAGLPTALPRIASTALDDRGICAVYRDGGDKPGFAVPPRLAPAFVTSAVAESATSRRGRADAVTLAPGAAAVVTSDSGSRTVFVVADSGRKFPATDPAVLAGFGYGGVVPTRVTAQVLALIPTGGALDPVAARRPTSS